MSLFEEDMNTVPKSPVYQYTFTRGGAGSKDQSDIPAAAAEEFAHSLELLSNTSLHLSLFRIILSDLKPDAAGKVMQRAFGNRGMISLLASGGFAVLLIGTETRETITNAMTVEFLHVAQTELGLRSRLEIAAIHRPAPEIGDPEDIIAQLSGLPTERYPVGRAA
jgi:hypothetical protein